MGAATRAGLADLVSFISSVTKRGRIFRKAAGGALPRGAMNLLAEGLHPSTQELVVTAVRRLSATVALYRLAYAEAGRKPASFRAGQYLSCGFESGGGVVCRPFSICSTPAEALGPGYYEIAVKSDPKGFVSALIAQRWVLGARVSCSGPAGFFHFQELRDRPELVCLAGGTGITPFRSMIRDALDDPEGPSFRLFHGAREPGELLFQEEFREQEARNPSRFEYVPVCEQSDRDWKGETGFVTRRLIEERVSLDGKQSFFVCGPPGMLDYLDRELSPLSLPRGRLRRESSSAQAARAGAVFEDVPGATFAIRLSRMPEAGAIPARADETVLVALERAGLSPPSLCRGGECGWCRSRLLRGELSEAGDSPGLRAADRKFGYFHPCAVYPRSDIVMDLPDNPILSHT